MTRDLETLAGTFPPGARGLRAIVLREFTLIKAARGKGWSWKDIAPALGLPAEKEHGLAETFRRVRLAVEAGRLSPEGPAATQEQKATPEPEQAKPADKAEAVQPVGPDQTIAGDQELPPVPSSSEGQDRPAPPERKGFKRIVLPK